jgi:hypothetical protein
MRCFAIAVRLEIEADGAKASVSSDSVEPPSAASAAQWTTLRDPPAMRCRRPPNGAAGKSQKMIAKALDGAAGWSVGQTAATGGSGR